MNDPSCTFSGVKAPNPQDLRPCPDTHPHTHTYTHIHPHDNSHRDIGAAVLRPDITRSVRKTSEWLTCLRQRAARGWLQRLAGTAVTCPAHQLRRVYQGATLPVAALTCRNRRPLRTESYDHVYVWPRSMGYQSLQQKCNRHWNYQTLIKTKYHTNMDCCSLGAMVRLIVLW